MVRIANTQFHSHTATCLFAKPRYNTHWATLRFVRRFFISVLLSPPAAHYFARRQPHFGCAQLVLLIAHFVPQIRNAPLSFACIVPPPPYASRNILRRLHMELASASLRSAFTDQPLVGARRHFRSFLPPVPFGGSPPALQCGQVCRTWLCFFLAAGAFTGFLIHCLLILTLQSFQ